MSNVVKCKKCLSFIQSKHVHDFVECSCGAVFVDGGNDYFRYGGNAEDIAVYFSEASVKELQNGVYADRNQVVQLLASLATTLGWVVGVRGDIQYPDFPVLYIETPKGQISWHIPLKEHVVNWHSYSFEWDGHSNKEKADRINAVITSFRRQEVIKNLCDKLVLTLAKEKE